MKILIPVDGSPASTRAVQFIAGQASKFKDTPELHLLNVQHALPGTVKGVSAQAKEHHHDEGMKVLAAARKVLDDAKLAHKYHIGVGDLPEVVAHFVKDIGADQLVMGTRGVGSVASAVLGSGAAKVLGVVNIPVLLVK